LGRAFDAPLFLLDVTNITFGVVWLCRAGADALPIDPRIRTRKHWGRAMADSAQKQISVHSPQNESERQRIYQFRYRVLVERLGTETIFADRKNKIIRGPPLFDGRRIGHRVRPDQFARVIGFFRQG
jgi:hypothetical protein